MRIGTLLLLLLAPLPAAQIASTAPAAGVAEQRAGRARAPIAISAAARGLDRVDGELWAVGATYKARFDRGGLMVVPPLGPEAPRSLPLWLSFESADIGDQRLATADGTAEPERGELEVHYRHGAALTERYEVRSDGLEQSFVFSELPAERGELVVRLRVATELAPRADRDGLLFESAPGRGLRVGALTAIDAAGRRAPGLVRLAEGALELVAPADFVEAAELPLVLDPLIGGPIDVSPAPGEVGDPEADGACGGGPLVLVAYERRWSADDIDIYGQRLDPDTAALVGPTVLLETSVSSCAMNPSVVLGAGAGGAAFFVVWQQGSSSGGPFDVAGRMLSVLPAPLDPDAWMTTTIVVANSVASESDPDVVPLTSFTVPAPCGSLRFLVAYARGGIRFRPVDAFDLDPSCGSAGAPAFAVGTEHTSDSSPSAGRPVLARLANFPEALVVWERFFPTPTPGDHDLQCAVVRNFGSPPSFLLGLSATAQSLASSVGPDETRADVQTFAGGDEVAVVFERSPSSASSDDDVLLTRLAFEQTTLKTTVTTGATTPVALGAGDDDDGAVVAHSSSAAEELWVAWIGHGTLGSGTVRAAGLVTSASLHPPIEPCEAEFEVAGSAVGVGFQDLDFDDSCFNRRTLVFESIGIGVYAQVLDPIVAVADIVGPPFLTGGCAPAGRTPAQAKRTCPCVIGANFTHALEDAPAGQPAFLILNTEASFLACGDCVLGPDPFSGFVIAAGPTSANGSATFATPLPDDAQLVGLTFYDQWAFVEPLPPCPQLGIGLSNYVQFEVQSP